MNGFISRGLENRTCRKFLTAEKCCQNAATIFKHENASLYHAPSRTGPVIAV